MIPIEYLRARLRADRAGNVYWLPLPSLANQRWNTRFAGKLAGHLNADGYLAIKLTYAGKQYGVRVHRVVWALTHGEWPTEHIDHVNRIKTDNRVENLRDVSIAENNQNQPPRALAVGVHRRQGKFIAQRMIDGDRKYLGTYDTPERARAAYLEGSPLPGVKISRHRKVARPDETETPQTPTTAGEQS